MELYNEFNNPSKRRIKREVQNITDTKRDWDNKLREGILTNSHPIRLKWGLITMKCPKCKKQMIDIVNGFGEETNSFACKKCDKLLLGL